VAVPHAIEESLCDDLNTPLAIADIHELANQLNRATTPAQQAPLRAQLLAAAGALGLLQQSPEVWFRWQPANPSGPTDAEIDAQIAARIAARKAKNYAESDRIRDALASQGVILEDSAGGTTWRRK
jgi:cysteinyl-tRNA synthetase